MLLNGEKIKKLIFDKHLIENYNIENISSVSYDVTASNQLLEFNIQNKVINLENRESIEKIYKSVDFSDGYTLKSKHGVLIVLNEKINMPYNMSGNIRPRTSLTRLGLISNVQHINVGYSGILNFLIYNSSPNSYRITPGMKIGQVIFEDLDNDVPEELLYENQKNQSYQNENGMEGSKIYNDYVGKVVRHYKGNYYFVENISKDSETLEDVVEYRALYSKKGSSLWVRPAKIFFEDVSPKRKDNITGQRKRFEIAEEICKKYT
jgi:dCTP deaminase